jgi:phosphatidate phosphatase APP1
VTMIQAWAASQSFLLVRDRPAASWTIQLNHEGFFSIRIPGAFGERTPRLSVRSPEDQADIGEFPIRLPATFSYLIVSDIDDTILVSEVLNKAKLVYNSLLKKGEAREAVPGTPAIYRDLFRQGRQGIPMIFYLTSSPAFMSRFLHDFLGRHRFPPGSILTKHSLRGSSHHDHKLSWLKRLAELYPAERFLLFGDTGEKDPAIYREFATLFPTRVLGIVLHDVDPAPRRQAELLMLQRSFNRSGVPHVIWKDPTALRSWLVQSGFLPSLVGQD